MGVVDSDVIVIRLRLLPVSVINACQNWIRWIRESGFRFAHRMDGLTESNLNPDWIRQIEYSLNDL